MAAIPALALGLTACGSGSDSASNEDDATRISPEQVVLSSYEDLAGESYQMEMTMTVNEITFLEAISVSDGGASHVSQDMYMSAMLEASGEEIPEDPETAEMMESLFSDSHLETIVVDDTAYLQFTGGLMDTSEQFGEDAWFTIDLSASGDLGQVYDQLGSLDLASQTETLLTELTDVEETGDGVYSGTLGGDSQIVQQMLASTAGGDPAAQQVLDGVELVVTVDDDGRLNKLEMTFPEIEGLTMHLVSEVVEVGGSYDITAPDSDNLHNIEELAGAMQ